MQTSLKEFDETAAEETVLKHARGRTIIEIHRELFGEAVDIEELTTLLMKLLHQGKMRVIHGLNSWHAVPAS